MIPLMTAMTPEVMRTTQENRIQPVPFACMMYLQ